MSFLSEATARDPSGLALRDSAGEWSYRDLSHAAGNVAASLKKSGVGRGHVVALTGRLDRNLLATIHGVWMAGGAIAPLHDGWPPEQRYQALDIVRPRLILTGEEFGPGKDFPPAAGEPLPRAVVRLSDDDPAAHIFTSGTSGEPRVVTLTMGNLRASAEGSRERLDLRSSDRWLASLAVSHVGGIALVTRAALLGSGLVLSGRFRVDEFIHLVETGSITHASLVPTMLHRILEAWGDRPAPPSLRCLLIGGAPISGALIEAATRVGFPIALTYGLTEASSQVATAPPDLVRKKPGSVGPPLPGVEVEIDETGELLVRGATVAQGQTEADGWLRTGDLAWKDAEGDLWITGRMSDRIISGGVNVDPAVVERALESHPGVVEVAVVGIPDDEWGERVVAAVVPTGSEDRLTEELAELARSALAPAQLPRDFRFISTLPRNPNGKVDRKGVHTLFR